MNSEKIGPETAHSQNMLNIQTHMATDRHLEMALDGLHCAKIKKFPDFFNGTLKF